MASVDASLSLAQCHYCDHAWVAAPDWVILECPECGHAVTRYSDPRWD